MKQISVILCTHNPKMDYLLRVLESLKHQSLDKQNWELIIVDNKSDIAVETIIDLSWHPFGNIVIEDALGLTAARLKGIKQSSSELLVFVDDDNILDADYLKNAIELCGKFPFLGAIGGSIEGEFEITPPKHLVKYLHYLAVRPVHVDVWSNLFEYKTTPVGAGMIIRKQVAQQYLTNVINDKARIAFDRKGSDLSSAGDIDMAHTSIDLGFGCGLFKDLKITHIIPTFRLQDDYIVKLFEANIISDYFLKEVRKQYKFTPASAKGALNRFVLKYNYWRHFSPFERKVYDAKLRASEKILKLIQN